MSALPKQRALEEDPMKLSCRGLMYWLRQGFPRLDSHRVNLHSVECYHRRHYSMARLAAEGSLFHRASSIYITY